MAVWLLRRLWAWALANAEPMFFFGRIASTLWFLSAVLVGFMVAAGIGDVAVRATMAIFSGLCLVVTVATFTVAHVEARNRVRRRPPR
jgi:hypothetical protein